ESVYAFGGYKRQAQVVVDRDKLAAYGLSILDLKKAIDGANVDRSAGTLTWMEGESIVRMTGRLRGGEGLEETVVGDFGGRPVLLSDVASSQDTFAERRSLYRFNGREAIEINIIQRPDASSPETIAAVRQELDRIKKEYPSLEFEEAYDNAHFVEIIKHNMFEELAVGVALTGLVVFLFLGDLRGTLIALVTIPTSLAVAVLLFAPFGLSLNSSTLIGLLLAIGRLVDDSIIDLHSVARHLEMGKTPREAAIDGCSEVRRSVIAATVMICLAMLPLTFSGGLTQNMFEGIVWPFLFCLAASLLVALTLTPLLAAHLYRGDSPWKERMRPWFDFLGRLESGYGRVLGWALGHRGLVMAVAAIAVYLAVALFPLIGYEMMPLADVGQAYAMMEARPGTSFAETASMAERLEKLLLEQPEIEKVSLRVGFEPGGTYFTGYAMGGVNTVNIMLTFKDKEERKRSIWQVIDAVHAEAKKTIPGIRRLSIKEMGSDVMASAMAPVELLIYGPDLERLSWLSEKTKAIMERDYPDIVQPATAWSLDQPELRLEVDQRRAAELGLTPAQVAEQAYYALNGGMTREFFNPPQVRHSTVLIRYRQEQRRGLKGLENVVITASDGRRVPLKSLAKITEERAPAVIQRDGLRRVNSVLGYYRMGGPGSMQLTMDVMMDSLMQLPYPPGYGMEQRGDMTQMMDSFYRLLWGMALALFFVYLSLVMQFHSLTQPLVMMAAIPLEMIGVFTGLFLAGQTFSTVSVLGIIVLNGMDVTASILLVDHILHLRQDGLERDEAIRRAGPVRLLPILMTVLITMVVMLPVALFPKTGMDAYSPLATVVVGGLAFSTVLTLVVVPVLYSLVDDFERWLKAHLTRVATVSLVLLLAVPGLAQPVQEGNGPAGFPVLKGQMTLEQALELGVEHSLPLAVAKKRLDLAQADVRRAASEGRLKMSAGGYLLWSNQATMWSAAPTVTPGLMAPVPGDDSAILRANLMFPLFTGGLLEARLEGASQSEKAAIAEVAQALQLLQHRIRTAYYDVVLAEGQVNLADWRVREQEEALRIFDEQLKAGRVAPFVVYRGRAELADAHQQANNARTTLTTAQAGLATAMGVSVASDFQLADFDSPEARPTDLAGDIELALADRPELVAARHGVASQLQRVRAVEAEFSPQLYLGAQYQGMAVRGQNYDGGFSAGLSLALPIFDGGERQARRDAAQALADVRQLDLRQAELEVTRAVTVARSRWETAVTNVQLARREVEQADEDLRIARLRNQVGRSVYLEILDALAASSRARLNLLKARHQAGTAYSELILVTGGQSL
ncbi:MAG: efflux RND transporter permease subunit, partial [Candidatus Eremiobacteraeota bacterium]|nr:efflux RND transporter permease subunit [Candidatus Eremiobacteraeota bacterium]